MRHYKEPKASAAYYNGLHYKLGRLDRLFRWNGFDWVSPDLMPAEIKQISKMIKRNIANKSKTPAFIKDGVRLPFVKLSDFALEHDVPTWELIKVIDGEASRYRGYTYDGPTTNVKTKRREIAGPYFFHKDGEAVVFDTLQEFQEITGVGNRNMPSIRRLCNCECSHALGYTNDFNTFKPARPRLRYVVELEGRHLTFSVVTVFAKEQGISASTIHKVISGRPNNSPYRFVSKSEIPTAELAKLATQET